MKKDKGVAIENPNEEEDDVEGDDFDRHHKIAQSTALPFSTRNASSKYDFVKVYSSDQKSSSIFLFSSNFIVRISTLVQFICVLISIKVKVWLGDNADHYYVLSRFLLSRMLTVTKVRASTSFFCLVSSQCS